MESVQGESKEKEREANSNTVCFHSSLWLYLMIRVLDFRLTKLAVDADHCPKVTGKLVTHDSMGKDQIVWRHHYSLLFHFWLILLKFII